MKSSDFAIENNTEIFGMDCQFALIRCIFESAIISGDEQGKAKGRKAADLRFDQEADCSTCEKVRGRKARRSCKAVAAKDKA